MIALSKDDFAAIMAAFEPFEPEPVIAVGVSGGADSLALCLLADAWARQRGGCAIALIVDHRLRRDSSEEAATAARRLADIGVNAHVLTRQGPAPANGLQAFARAARLTLLSAWCRSAGVLHLMLAHHRYDQAETVVMRDRRRTGPVGSPGIAPVIHTPWLRILRPLLTVEPERLRALLRERGIPWVEDPSNRDRRFERVRIRDELRNAGGARDTAAALAETHRTQDTILEDEAAARLAASAFVHPAGYARLPADFVQNVADGVAVTAMSRLLTTIGGREARPAAASVLRLVQALRSSAGAQGAPSPSATLHACRIVTDGTELLICRENRNLPTPLSIQPGQSVLWDGRFAVSLAASAPGGPYRVAALGSVDAADVNAAVCATRHQTPFPAAILRTLPAIVDDSGLVAVPHLGYHRGAGPLSADVRISAAFQPSRPVLPGGPFLAGGLFGTMSP